jgi:hypothetical protein
MPMSEELPRVIRSAINRAYWVTVAKWIPILIAAEVTWTAVLRPLMMPVDRTPELNRFAMSLVVSIVIGAVWGRVLRARALQSSKEAVDRVIAEAERAAREDER